MKVWACLLILTLSIFQSRAQIGVAKIDYDAEAELHRNGFKWEDLQDRKWWDNKLPGTNHLTSSHPPYGATKCMCTKKEDLLFIYSVVRVVQNYYMYNPASSHLQITISPCGGNPDETCVDQDNKVMKTSILKDSEHQTNNIHTDAFDQIKYSCRGVRIFGKEKTPIEPAIGQPIRCAVYWTREIYFIGNTDFGFLHFNPCVQMKGRKYGDNDVKVEKVSDIVTTCTYGPPRCLFYKINPDFAECKCKDVKDTSCKDAYDNCNQEMIPETDPTKRKLINNTHYIGPDACDNSNAEECKHNPELQKYFCQKDECRPGRPLGPYCHGHGDCTFNFTKEKSVCSCHAGFLGEVCNITDFCYNEMKTVDGPCLNADGTNESCRQNIKDDGFQCGNTTVDKTITVYPRSGGSKTELVSTGDACGIGWYGPKCNVMNRCENTTLDRCNSMKCGKDCCQITSVDEKIDLTGYGDPNTQYYYYNDTCSCGDKYKGQDCEEETLCPKKCPTTNVNVLKCEEMPGTTVINCVCKPGFSDDSGICDKEDFCETTWKGTTLMKYCGEPPFGKCLPSSTATARFCDCNGAAGWVKEPEENPLDKFKPLKHLELCKEDRCHTKKENCNSDGTRITHKITDLTAPLTCCECHDLPDEKYSGEYCDTREFCKETKDRCSVHFGTCTITPDKTDYNCNCPADRMRDKNCNILDKCIQNPDICDNPTRIPLVPTNNTCEYDDGDGRYNCTCGDEWKKDQSITASNCFIKRYCISQPCNKDGTIECDEREFSRRCKCDETKFYIDTKSEHPSENCATQEPCADKFFKASISCNYQGTQVCTKKTAYPYVECTCKPEYYHGNGTDQKCAFENPCGGTAVIQRKTCSDNGECIPHNLDFNCSCDLLRPGVAKYHGDLCEYLDACAVHTPCQNGGTCNRSKNSYTCNCTEGFPILLNSNCSRRDPCHSRFAHIDKCEHGGHCSRIDDNNLECDCSGTGYVGPRCKCPQTIVQFYYPTSSTVSVGEENLFIVVVKELGENPTVIIDMGDGFKFRFHSGNLRLVSDTEAVDSVLTPEGIRLLKGLPNRKWQYFAFVYTFRKSGLQTVTTKVYDCFDRVKGLVLTDYHLILTNQYNVVIGRCLPYLKLRNCAHDTEKIPVYERKSRFVITTSYYSNCSSGDEFKFRWQLYSLTEKHPFPQPTNNVKALEDRELTEHVNDDNNHIVFKSGKLVRGDYWIEILVYIEDSYGTEIGKWKADWCYFNVENSPPSAIIKGGLARTLHYRAAHPDPVELDASDSRDETDPTQSKKLKFKWHWRIAGSNPDPVTVKNKCSKLLSTCKDDEAVIRVILKPSLLYSFSVDVSSVRPTGEPDLSSTAIQEIQVVPNGLRITAQCIKNCERFNPGDRVQIRCGCDDQECKSGVVYSHSWDGGHIGGGVRSIRPNIADGEYMITLGVAAKPRYGFICNGVLRNGKLSGFSKFGIQINEPPVSGSCTMSSQSFPNEVVQRPPRLIALHSYEFFRDPLQLTCDGFQDVHKPLTYEVNARILGSKDILLPTGVLLFYDVYPTANEIYLPLGTRANFSALTGPSYTKHGEFEVEVSIVVSDSYGLPQNPALKETVLVLDPLPASIHVTTLLPVHVQLGLKGVIAKVLGTKAVEGEASIRSKGGDHQGALHLVLSCLYTRKENELLRTIMPKDDVKQLGDVVGEIISRVILHSYLIVKQVIQTLYLYAELSEDLTDSALKNGAEQLIKVASYFRIYVVDNEEIIFTKDIIVLARAAKHAAELIMAEVKKRGDAEIKLLNLHKQNAYELNLHHLYRVDRDYFLEEDDIFAVEYNSSRGEDVADLGLGGHIETLSSICQKAYQCIIDLMLAVAEREVYGSIDLPDASLQQVFASISLRRMQDLKASNDFTAGPGSKGVITIPGQAVTLISQQIEADKDGGRDIQLHVIESKIDPYFGDVTNSVKTAVLYILINNDKMIKDHYQFIRIRENLTDPVIVKLPLLEDPIDVVVDTIDDSKPIMANVKLIPLEEIDHSNRDVKIHHLTLIHGSRFYVQITLESTDPKLTSIEFMVAAVRNYRPNINDFCTEDVDVAGRVKMSGASIQIAVFLAEIENEHKRGKNQEEHFEEEYLDYYVGIWPFDESGTNDYGTELNYSVKFVQLSCLTRNEDENEWTGQGCEVEGISDARTSAGDHFLLCRCHHLSIFAGSIVVPPNRIDFFANIDLGLELQTNWIVLLVVCLILLAYGICHGVCLYLDRRDKVEHVGITIMCATGEDFHHSFYLVNVITGSRISSGTTASVSMRIYGSNGRSQAYVLKDPTLHVLNRGGNDSFLISSSLNLGELEKVMIWHDNTGSRPGWYLRKIIIRDLKTDKEWYFFCDTWFSVTYEKDPSIIRTLVAATEAEKKAWKRRFMDRLVDEFNNSHLWFSVFFRLPTSNFTRCQRLVCSVGILTSYLLINIMYHGYPTNDYSHIFEVGGIAINYLQIYIGFLVSALSLPFGIILVMLFQRIRKHRIPTVVIWKNRTKHLGNVDYNESYLFSSGGTEKHIVPVTVGRVEGEEENTEPFAFPDTDPKLIEAWIKKDTRGHGLRPLTNREPDAFVHKVDDHGDMEDGNHLLRIGRQALATGIREEDKTSFIYEGHGSFEEQFDRELAARVQMSQHPWTRFRARDIHALEAEKRKELPTVEPVIVAESDGKEHEILYDGIAIEVYEMRPQDKKCCYLPWPFLWVSWTIALLIILTASFFTVWAGLQMGPIRSVHWLTEVAFSFVQAVAITQPLRIIIVGFFMSLIFRKLHATDEDRYQILIKEGDEDIGKQKKIKVKPFRPARSIPPLTGAAIFGLRMRARKRNELKRNLYSIIIHILVMFFIYFVALENHSGNLYEVSAHVKTMLDLKTEFDNCRNCDNQFANIKTQKEALDYLATKFLDVVNPRFDYNDKIIPPPKDLKYDSAMLYDNETMMIGVPRLRQIRILPHECRIHENVKKYYLGAAYNPLDPRTNETRGKINCTGRYAIQHVDNGTYNPQWQPVINNTRSWSSRNNDVWSYKTANQTKSIPFRGELAIYEAGGYVAELGMEYRKTKGMLNYLDQTKWLDMLTRALFIEMTAAIPNVNIYVDIVLIIERSPSGAYITSSQIYPLKLSYNDDEEFIQKWIAICYICICVFLIGLSIMLVKNVVHSWRYTRSNTWTQIGLWIDFFIVISCLVSIAVAFKLHHVSELARTRLRETLVNEFMSLQDVSYWDYLHTSSFAVTLALCIVKLWKLLVLAFERFYVLSLTLKLASGYLFGFVFLVSLLTTAFAFWGVLEFGSSMEQFHSVPHAFLELMNQLLNPSFYEDLHAVHSVVGPIYFVIFGFTICFVGLNLLIALLTHSYYEAKEIARQRGPMLTYWSYIRRWKWYVRLFAWTTKEDPNEKLILNPLRLREMERLTKAFLRQVTQHQEFTRMNEVRDYANNEMLKGTGLKMVSKAEKKRQTRLAMNTTVHVSEQRMEEMRLVTVYFLRRALQHNMTGEEVRGYTRHNKEILTARIAKLEEVQRQVMRLYETVRLLEDEQDRRQAEEARVRQEQLRTEAAEREARARENAALRRRRRQPSTDNRRLSSRSGDSGEPHASDVPPAAESPGPAPSWRRPSASSTSASWRSIGSGQLPMTNAEYRQRKEDLEHPRGRPREPSRNLFRNRDV